MGLLRNLTAGYDHLGAWRVRCGGCGWPLLWAWVGRLGHDGLTRQHCRNCTPRLPTGPPLNVPISTRPQ